MRVLTRPVLLSPLIIFGFFLNIQAYFEEGTFDPVLEAGQKIHATSKVFGGGTPSRSENHWLVIDSPIPISVLRYHDTKYYEDEAPLDPGVVHIVVKSDGCPDDVVESIVASITATEAQCDCYYTESVKIEVEIGDDNVDVVEYDFPDPATTFHAVWDYLSFWCCAVNNDPNIDPERVTTCPAEDISSGTTPEPDPNDISSSTSPTTPETDPNDEDTTRSPTSSPNDTTRSPTSSPADTIVSPTSFPSGESGSTMLRPKILSWTVVALLVSSTLFLFHSNATVDRSLMTICFVLVLVVIVVGSDDIKDYVNAKTAASRELEGTCRIGAELLLDACFQSLSITAPSVRVLDVVMINETGTCDPLNPCHTNYEANMTFPGSVVFPSNMTTTPADEGRETFEIPTLDVYANKDRGFCERFVEGRPFVDANGSQLQAKAAKVDKLPKNDDKTSWSSTFFEDKIVLDVSSDTKQLFLKSLAVEWTRRALGEHASIASFAAFTMALLTNQAPPDLVQDSLAAAMDEVRHAKVSFEVASLLRSAMGEGPPVEPGPLPHSTHEFQSDMTALAIGAAKEGCIEETLTALVAAVEADFYGAETDNGDMGVISSILQKKMNIIAMEEGRHSILAWRRGLYIGRVSRTIVLLKL